MAQVVAAGLEPTLGGGRLVKEMKNPVNWLFVAVYRPLLCLALRAGWLVLALTLGAFASIVVPLTRTGGEFMSALYEGDFLYMPTTLPGASIIKARGVLAQTNRLIGTLPEVERVFGKVGRADTATDPAAISMIGTWVKLKPRENWRPGLTPRALTAELDARTKLPGLVNSWGYPIKNRMDMISTGIRTQVGLKISGNDLPTIERLALAVEGALRDIDGIRFAIPAASDQGGRPVVVRLGKFSWPMRLSRIAVSTC